MESLKNSVMKYEYQGRYEIRSHEIDHQKRVTLPSLIMLMQEASMQNARENKISVWDLEDKHQSWVLLRKEIQVYRYPLLNEKIIIKTYPAGFDRIFAYRDFFVFDYQDNLLASASSTWTLMDLLSRKMIRIPPAFLHLQPDKTESLLPLPDSTIEKNKRVDNEYQYMINYFDLDWNSHVNNVVYIRLMLQSLSADWHQKNLITAFFFHIKAECLYQDELTMQVEINSNKAIHQILKKDGTLAAQAISFYSIRK